ncbi:MAG: GxxExxY protein [bacterium]
MAEEILYKDLNYKIVGAPFEVYKVLGYGFLEKVYENALLVELRLQGIPAEGQHPVDVLYKGEQVGEYRADILVENKIIVELKAEKEYNPTHEAQLINYLKATGIKVGILINFGEKKCEHKRLIY